MDDFKWWMIFCAVVVFVLSGGYVTVRLIEGGREFRVHQCCQCEPPVREEVDLDSIRGILVNMECCADGGTLKIFSSEGAIIYSWTTDTGVFANQDFIYWLADGELKWVVNNGRGTWLWFKT